MNFDFYIINILHETAVTKPV